MPSKFTHWLRSQIAEMPCSITAFSKLAGVSEQSIHRWLKQNTPHIRPYNITLIARALGISRDEVNNRVTASRSTKTTRTRRRKVSPSTLTTVPGRSGNNTVSPEPLPATQTTAGENTTRPTAPVAGTNKRAFRAPKDNGSGATTPQPRPAGIPPGA